MLNLFVQITILKVNNQIKITKKENRTKVNSVAEPQLITLIPDLNPQPTVYLFITLCCV